MILGEWRDQWLEGLDGIIRPNTLKRYRRTVRNHIKPQFGDKVVFQVTPKDIQGLYERLGKEGNINTANGLSSGTVRGSHNMLRFRKWKALLTIFAQIHEVILT